MNPDKKPLRTDTAPWTRVHEWDKEKISLKQALNLKINRIKMMLLQKGLERVEIVYSSSSNIPIFYSLCCSRRSRMAFLKKVASQLIPTDAKKVPGDDFAVLLVFSHNVSPVCESTRIKDARSGFADETWPTFLEDIVSYRQSYGPWKSEENSFNQGIGKGDNSVLEPDLLNRYLSLKSAKEVREKVRHFRQLDFRRMSYGEVHSAVKAVISAVDEKGETFHVIPMNWVTYEEGSQFYRVVKHSVTSQSDLWGPPEEKARIGRLNLDGESVLYTSPSLDVALDEMNVQDGELTTVIQYSSSERLKLTQIGMFRIDDAMPSNHGDVLDELNDFFRDEFLRDVGEGTEYLYKISNVLSEYFVGPESVGYYYPSMRMKRKWNVCFDGEDIERRLKVTLVGQFRFWRDPHVEYMKGSCECKADLRDDGRVVWPHDRSC